MARDPHTAAPHRAAPARPARRRWLGLLLVGLLGLAAFGWWYLQPTPPPDGSPPVSVAVRPGEGWSEVAGRLRAAGIVRTPLTFLALVQLSGEREGLQPGRYALRRGMSSGEIIAALTDPEDAAALTVPEGWRAEQVGEALAEGSFAIPEAWRAALASPPAFPLLDDRPSGAGLTGYLYPGTYRFTESDPARELIASSTGELARRVTPELRAGLQAQGLSLHEGLTLASIVERETRVAAERATVASVYLNRLRDGMRLQADPTVQYVVGRPGDWWKAGLTRQDLRDPSPYNTYVHEGLPPGPICSPGIAALEAVARPATTPYLYFVARGDGTHLFARTYAEHEENIRRVRGR